MTGYEFNKKRAPWRRMLLAMAGAATLFAGASAQAGIAGWNAVNNTTPTFNLTAREGYISVSDGGSVYSWGYSQGGINSGNNMQLPGPTLIVREGAQVTVRLWNNLPTAAGNVSIVFPGQVVDSCTANCGVTGELTNEAQPGAFVEYTFTASTPGTFQYHSGTDPDLQVEMGLFGTLIVRPAEWNNGASRTAYGDDTDTYYDREYLYVLSEIDLDTHVAAEMGRGGEAGSIVIPGGQYHPEYWLMNGRAGPDTMAGDNLGSLPYQPYGSLTRMHPGEKLLIRVVGAGREQHPFHTHGNHARLLARDGRPLLNGAGNLAGPLLFTIPSVPGGTADAIFEWTGKELGWDMYGHTNPDDGGCVDDNGDGYDDGGDNAWEWCADHGKPIPVELPSLTNLAFGGFYSGSPFLGALGSLPPGEGGLNPGAGFAYMWHSHTERELVNNDVFPGGMMTMLIVEAPFVTID